MQDSILNLGCGLKTSDDSRVINIDWSVRLRLRKLPLMQPMIRMLIGSARREKFDALPDNIMVHDLSKGIPFPNESVSAVYHSHMLEHLDRNLVPGFAREVLRVLRPGGVHRIVVPDLEHLCRDYIKHLEICGADDSARTVHDQKVANILEQCVRRDAASSANHGAVRKRIEKILLGDARKRGETHQWMYDKVNLAEILQECGYREITVADYQTSRIPEWNRIGLDLNDDGSQYKPGSLYLEAFK